MNIEKIMNAQREYFNLGETKDINFRIEMLKKLKISIVKNEDKIYEALSNDLNKSRVESYISEINVVLKELDKTIKNVMKWSKKKQVKTPISLIFSKSYIVCEPYGSVLIISPWNYPFLLTLQPLIGAIAAGNTVVIKPSDYSSNVSLVIYKIISEVFCDKYVSVVLGSRDEISDLLLQKFDYIFFTGSTQVGKLVMQKAAENLTPVTLELGGKSPCIVDRTANLKLSAKKIIFGKLLNAGQTCIAPDYIFVHSSIKEKFIEYLKNNIIDMLGNDPISNENYPKIINKKHFDRLNLLIEDQNVVFGGKSSIKTNKIEPTILDNIDFENKIMKEEIFGPILPIITYDELSQTEEYINSNSKPLALYLFTNDKKVEKRILKNVSFGGGCINDTIMHIANSNLPFGGVGESGMGQYHGEYTFHTFTHFKAIVKKYNFLDINLRYMPYTKIKFNILKRILK